MGLFDGKTRGDNVADEAREAHSAGQRVFAAMLSHHPANPVKGFYTGTIAVWAADIQSIEAAGWRLDQWSVTSQPDGMSRAYPVFRRVS